MADEGLAGRQVDGRVLRQHHQQCAALPGSPHELRGGLAGAHLGHARRAMGRGDQDPGHRGRADLEVHARRSGTQPDHHPAGVAGEVPQGLEVVNKAARGGARPHPGALSPRLSQGGCRQHPGAADGHRGQDQIVRAEVCQGGGASEATRRIGTEADRCQGWHARATARR